MPPSPDISSRIDGAIAALKADGLIPAHIRLSTADMDALAAEMDAATPHGPRFRQVAALDFYYEGLPLTEGGQASVVSAKSPGPREFEHQLI